MLRKYVTFLCILWTFLNKFSSGAPDHISTQLNNEVTSTERILSRQRRYLVFLEGSSIKLGYSHGVGLNTSVKGLFLGASAGISWKLPSKPPGEIISELRKRLRNNTDRRHDVDKNLFYLDDKFYKEDSEKPDRFYGLYNMKNDPQMFPNHNHKADQLYSLKTHPFEKWVPKPPTGSLRNSNQNYVWKKDDNSFPHYSGQRDHRIYPVFGKKKKISQFPYNQQSRQDLATSEPNVIERLHIEHHRSTRSILYEQIEGFLNTHGQHGHHCVLKTLCESGQKVHEQKPGSFVGEILRAVFTIPESSDANPNTMIQVSEVYDSAHNFEGNCAERYHLCNINIWKYH